MTENWLPPEEYVQQLPRCTAYACLYFTDTEGHPFQLRSTHSLEAWQWPGGNLDRDELPWECAVRECEEETGIVFTGPQRLLAVHFVRPRAQWKANHIGFIFDGGVLTAEQLADVKLSFEHTEWSVRTVEEWQQEMTEDNFARLRHVDEAWRTGTTAYFVT